MSLNERKYSIPDSTLLQHGATVAASLPDDIGDFQSFDSTFSDSYPNDIVQCIMAVEAIKTDMVVIDEMSEKTQSVTDAMAACNTAFRTIKFFVERVFKDNKAVKNQLGLNDIAKVRNDQGRMIVFMNDLGMVVNKYRDQLVAAGCSAAVIDSLPQLRNKLKETKTDQELFKKERGVITQERVEKLNVLYGLLLPVSVIAQIIYADDAARLAKYLLPSPKSSTNSSDDLITS